MAVPPIVVATTPAVVNRYCQWITKTSLDFTPSMMHGTRILAGTSYDMAGLAHLVSNGWAARRVRTPWGTWAMEVTATFSTSPTSHYPPHFWRCPTLGLGSYAGDQAFLSVQKALATGIGGTYKGCARGPDPTNPHTIGGANGGLDRGNMWSKNSGGREGFAFYGTEPGASPRTFKPNKDWPLTTGSAVGQWRADLTGRDQNLGGAGVDGGYMWGHDADHQIVEYHNEAGAVGGVGDCSAPDAHLLFGRIEYGPDAFPVVYASIQRAVEIAWADQPARNVTLHRTAIVTHVHNSLAL